MISGLVKSETSHRCLYLPLQGYVVVDSKCFYVSRHRSPGGVGSSLRYSAAYSPVTFSMSSRKGFGALANVWQYYILRTA